jgi:Tol biopolymer transport system component
VIEERDLFERAVQRFAPAEDSFERLLDRRDRKRRNKRVTAGVVALLLAVLVIGAALRAIDVSRTAPATPNPLPPLMSNGDISFVGSNLIDFSDQLSDFGILFAVDPAGGHPRKLLDTECPSDPEVTTSCGHVGIGSVDWSPDGTRIAFALFEGGPGSSSERDGIYVMVIGSGKVRQLTSCTDPCLDQDDLDWSPDGSRIGYVESYAEGCTTGIDAFDAACHSLYSMNPDGTDRAEIQTGSVVDPVEPSWSPDGSSIAFSARAGEDWFVYTMALDGSEPVRLAADLPSLRPTQPAWSPDGSMIAFVTGRDPENGIPFTVWSMGVEGSERRRLYESCCMIGGAGYGVQGPVWSPDGAQILVFQGTGGALQLIDPDTGEVVEVPTRKPTGPIAWQPIPDASSADQTVVTFWFDFDGEPPTYHHLYVNGEWVKGQTSNTPEDVYRYVFDPDRRVDLPPGAPIVVNDTGDPDEIRAWVDACCGGSTSPPRLYELDLAGSPSLPDEPGRYVVEFTVSWIRPGEIETFTTLFPVRVVAPED